MSPEIQIVPFDNTIHNLLRAVKERVFYVKNTKGEFVPPPRPKQGVYASRLSSVGKQLAKFLPSTVPLNYQQFVDTFKGCKKALYQSALASMREQDVSLAEASTIKVFVKYEKVDRTNKGDPVPRVISPRTPIYNLKVGRYLRPIEKRIFKAISQLFGHKTVMKGMNTDTVAKVMREKWDKYRNPVALGLDASRFDQHVSRDALAFEHEIYTSCFWNKRDKSKLKELLKYQLDNRCVGYCEDGKLEYRVEGTRMSGDMNTSLGNCLLMCLMVKAYAEVSKVDISLANNGDDCVVFMESHDLNRFSTGLNKWFLEMGFNMVVEPPAYEFEHVEFCQTKPVFDGKIWTMCRNPYTAVAKDCILLKNPKNMSNEYIKAWFEAVGTGGLALAGGMPIFNSFYRCFQRSGTSGYRNCKRAMNRIHEFDILPWYMREVQLSGSRGDMPPSDEARASFYLAFDITPDEQIAQESYYDSMTITTDMSLEWYPRSVNLH